MAVGFDIDDTVLFFQSGLLARQKTFSPERRRLSEKSCVLGKNEQWLG
ncbi:hypothetical protein [Escherichia coli ISC7]|uniref:Uncharacterized protein n=1 Tax=Escherichia coli ISC7 TaxID=1432555 RepID=W1EWA1_ECOLX|nr:hypothetical protein [Escherichia coli ISC7]